MCGVMFASGCRHGMNGPVRVPTPACERTGDIMNDKTYDLNGDGVPDEVTRIGDHLYIDYNRDGKFDAMVTPDGEIYADLDGDHTYRTRMVDSDGDGVIDTLETDLDGDGIPDIIEKDTTGDGVLDTVVRPGDDTGA